MDIANKLNSIEFTKNESQMWGQGGARGAPWAGPGLAGVAAHLNLRPILAQSKTRSIPCTPCHIISMIVAWMVFIQFLGCTATAALILPELI